MDAVGDLVRVVNEWFKPTIAVACKLKLMLAYLS